MDAETEDDQPATPACGYRARWKRLRGSVNDSIDVDSPEIVHADPQAGSSLWAEVVLSDAVKDEIVPELLPEEPVEYEPSSCAASVSPQTEPQPFIQLASPEDNEKAVSSAASRHMHLHSVKLPWETDFAKCIFGDELPNASLAFPIDWSAQKSIDEIQTPEASAIGNPQTLDWAVGRCVKNMSDRSYIEQKEIATLRAINKILVLVRLAPNGSQLGTQLESGLDDPEETVRAVIGVKSPHTVLKRVNSLLSFYRWCAASCNEPCFPIKERMVWQFLQFLKASGAAPTRAQSFVQALRFAYFTFGLHGSLDAVQSRRITGSAELQWALKRPTIQARPLSVCEVKKLHDIAADPMRAVVDRVMASNLLLMLYGRCRNSDTAMVHEVLHDHSAENGFLEITTRYHKGSKSAQKKATLLPILMDTKGVVEGGWVEMWVKNRKEAGLPVAGLIDGALLPAPAMKEQLHWNQRPLTSGEVTSIVRALLSCSDALLTSHSLKATTLSWAAKAGVSRELRKNLGRHSCSVEGSDGFYSRDLCVEPVRALSRVFEMIRSDSFRPDAERSNYFVGGNTNSLNLLPSTPTFLGIRQAMTPAPAQPSTPTHTVCPKLSNDKPVQVKDEREPTDGIVKTQAVDCILVESSSSEGSSSDSCSDEQSTSDEDEALLTRGPEGHRAGEASSVSNDAQWPVFDAWVRHLKTKVCHRFESLSEPTPGNIAGKVTCCGRKVGDRFEPCEHLRDFDRKCKLCLKSCK
ncbi:unnamed protein product [Durusdinium trenchii]|uniref:Core-binding (CB) domain-containing protein n=1 Tax=Durusdinium trenchii TaxID=1381693 RepID=A0ABP0K838_9DINO